MYLNADLTWRFVSLTLSLLPPSDYPFAMSSVSSSQTYPRVPNELAMWLMPTDDACDEIVDLWDILSGPPSELKEISAGHILVQFSLFVYS